MAAVLALITTVAIRETGGDQPVSATPGTSASPPNTADGGAPTEPQAEEGATVPSSGPPYVSVPDFSSTSARDAAFVGDVAQFSTWPSGTESYGAMSSAPGGGDISAFRKAVIRDAESVCDALIGGTDMNEVPDGVGLALTDPIDQAAFIVEAVTFYCPDQMAAATNGVYSKPVATKQSEDCPTTSVLKVTAAIGDQSDSDDNIQTAAYTLEVRNTSSYEVRAQLQQRWFADGFTDNEWGSFGDVIADQVVTIKAGETFTYEGEQTGIYRWNRTKVRVQPGEFVFFGCGYQPGPGAATEG
ncbi:MULTISPECIES: DUF732 domain-containing protein [unclassified Streptomyces]|uniref:DUF732 domain-containing protein n=1 Tax=unclassified Streptomyces TaxID=2593676 RepID=UPI002DD8EA04|nr:DUF732 domain-containing protein [Streptomyces sp. NBC_01750]WSB04884.1 DUF732 domain-containing protein [Streptomyces sp. NBC_01794]WSD30838.1 DUF732 domain-containing protein [Streptomyces sp. NBC_01750]